MLLIWCGSFLECTLQSGFIGLDRGDVTLWHACGAHWAVSFVVSFVGIIWILTERYKDLCGCKWHERYFCVALHNGDVWGDLYGGNDITPLWSSSGVFFWYLVRWNRVQPVGDIQKLGWGYSICRIFRVQCAGPIHGFEYNIGNDADRADQRLSFGILFVAIAWIPMEILKNWCGVTEMARIFEMHVAILILGFEWHICNDSTAW